ncbi:MAG: hypothetical protein KIT09_15720 [Bryobacteraceae bacterium]|nr:hypothetical protein [Bryobacteraceae bacterium]
MGNDPLESHAANGPRRWIGVAPVAVLLVLAGYAAAREAWAEFLFDSSTRAGVEAAVSVRPARALYWSGLAEALDRDGEDPLPAMRRAVEASPNDDALRIQLGLRAEAAGQIDEAERELLEAARLSRKYAPRWTQANFYYRRRDAGEFRRWAREALAISYGDRRPLFDLCSRLGLPPREILDRVIPPRRPVVMDYATYLAANGDPENVELVVELARDALSEENDYFLHHADRLLDAWRFAPALAVWNALCSRGFVPYEPLDRASVVTNGSFSPSSLGRGFDWRVAGAPGVFVSPVGPHGWSVWLGGNQPEECELLSQFLPLEPEYSYRVRFRYRARSSDDAADGRATGLAWAVFDRSGTQIGGAALPVSRESREGDFTCSTLAGEPGVRLVLAYRRPAGSARFQGELALESLTADPRR